MEQRVIKFKIWDKQRNRMSKEVPVFCPLVQWSDGDIDMPTDFALAKNNRFIFLQFTGLLDQNGVEVYVGDIDSSKKEPRVIVWDNVHLCYLLVWKSYYKKWLKHGIDKAGCTFEKVTSTKKLTIIGNLFQNPNLL